ncbi:hypothetical protein MPSYJ_52980 [Mycolicibacterium psychrotolerans]|uniref:MBL fold metallo-hydrolase n=1 Tax=Mycolicibacterium psychrotolerans TaxID=216929 RepID=A0A7I7MJ80_9MYCO|nr:hypothetical protein MPSYJ_52980 [Mycolicibacterium psychrotolerans]
MSGHLELVDATGAWIGFGEAAQTDYPIRCLADGEHISLGEVDLEMLSTPGHTWESISVLVRERPDAEPTAVLTGDSLFIGDVGRPDLVNIGDSSTGDLARAIYRTVHDSAIPRRWRPAASRARSTCRWRNCVSGWAGSPPAGRSSCTARAVALQRRGLTAARRGFRRRVGPRGRLPRVGRWPCPCLIVPA